MMKILTTRESVWLEAWTAVAQNCIVPSIATEWADGAFERAVEAAQDSITDAKIDAWKENRDD